MIDPERTAIRFPVTVLLAIMHAGACRYFFTGSVIDQYNMDLVDRHLRLLRTTFTITFETFG